MPNLPQPQEWGCPIKLDDNERTLSSFITTPSRVCGFILDLMRLKFSNPDNIYHEKLRVYTYNQNPMETNIKIEPGFDYLDTDTLTDLQPGIVVSMGDTAADTDVNCARQSTLGLSDGFFNSVNDIALIQGSVVINAVSPSPLESLLLAEDIFLWLLLFQYNIQDDLQLGRFAVKLLKGPEKPDTQGKICFVSSVQLEWSSAIKFTTNINAPLISEEINTN